MGLWWKYIAWPWVKQNWHWVVLFPAGLFLLVRFLSREKPVPRVVSSELSGAELTQREADEQFALASDAAAEQKQLETELVDEEHAASVRELEDRQSADVESLRNDPEALNQHLKNVGKKMSDRSKP